MRDSFRQHHRLTESERAELQSKATFALDANVLLNIHRFADATAADRAQPLTRLQLTHSEAFARLEGAGVLRPVGLDRYCLDESAVIAQRTTGAKRSLAGVILVLGLLLLGGLMALGALTVR
jgi:hypothetical protein